MAFNNSPTNVDYRGKMVIQVAAMCFCITAAVAALKLSGPSGEAALLENAWAYLHPFIDKAIHLDVVSAGLSDVSGVEIQMVLSALPNALLEYLDEFIRQHPGGVGNALENDIVAQYLMYGTAKAVSLVICTKVGCSCRAMQIGDVLKLGVTINPFFGTRYTMKSLCHVELMCALCLETWAVSGFLYEKLFSDECQLQGLPKFGGHSEAFLVNGLKYAKTRLDIFLAIGKNTVTSSSSR